MLNELSTMVGPSRKKNGVCKAKGVGEGKKCGSYLGDGKRDSLLRTQFANLSKSRTLVKMQIPYSISILRESNSWEEAWGYMFGEQWVYEVWASWG